MARIRNPFSLAERAMLKEAYERLDNEIAIDGNIMLQHGSVKADRRIELIVRAVKYASEG